MKSFVKIALIPAIAATLLFNSCKKEDPNDVYDAVFYQSHDANNNYMKLYIDEVEKGIMPYMKDKRSCSNDEISFKALRFRLSAGTYCLELRNEKGHVVSSSTIKFSKSKNSVKTSGWGHKGGTEMSIQDQCLVVRMY